MFADRECRGLGGAGVGVSAGKLLPRLLHVARADTGPETAGVLLLLGVKDRGRTLLGEVPGRTVPWGT